jgi:signal transduction histidine kinase
MTAAIASTQILPEFLKSKSGRNFMLFATLCAMMAIGIGVGSYLINLHWFEVDKGAEKVTALELVDSFVAEYSKVRGALKADGAPVPATFRAHAIEQFNKKRRDGESLRLLMVGPAGREIAIPPADAEMAATIERFMRETNPKPETRFTSVDGNLMFRTIYPSVATQQSCVDCHNMHQAGKVQWRLNDVMGALAIEVPAAGFLRHNLMLSVAIGLVVFLVSTAIGAVIFAMQFRELRLRERTEQTLRLAAAEIELLNRDLERRVDERTAELRTVQDELLRKERLSTLGQLTATVAHELRNPLSSIRNTVFAINAAVAEKGLNLERPLARMERGIARCDRIITDLLDYTRIREMKRVPVRIEPWLTEVLDDQKLPEGITLVRRFGAADARVSGDIERLRRVVINLVDNAAQAMAEPAGRERRVTVATRRADGCFELAIEDTGAGIPPDVLPRVFEPLFSTKSFGTGLGLATVKQIVEEHGGTIGIASEAGQGTRVTITLPIVGPAEMAA